MAQIISTPLSVPPFLLSVLIVGYCILSSIDGGDCALLKSRVQFLKANYNGGRFVGCARNASICSDPLKNPNGGSTCCFDTLCKDLTTDTWHCGKCGFPCPFGLTCCSGFCVDIKNDPMHCGNCFSRFLLRSWRKIQLHGTRTKSSTKGLGLLEKAYFRQYQRDFNAFLRVRAEELVLGGRIFLVLTGRTSRDPSDQGFIAFPLESLGSSFNDLVSQGLIEEEKVDSFNIPLYATCAEEVSEEVERQGSFEILRLEVLRKSERFSEEEMEAMTGSSASLKDAYGRKLAKQLRAVTESLIKHHFGEEIMDALFERFGERMGKRLSERM